MEGTRKINTVLLSLLCLQHKTQARVLPQSKSTLWVGVWVLLKRCGEGRPGRTLQGGTVHWQCAPAHRGAPLLILNPQQSTGHGTCKDTWGSLSSLHPKGNSLSPSFNEIRAQIKHNRRLHPLIPLYSEGVFSAFHLAVHKSKEKKAETLSDYSA